MKIFDQIAEAHPGVYPVESIRQPTTSMLSRGIKEEDILHILGGEGMQLEHNGLANAALPFSGSNNDGLKISWTYGSQNNDYLSVILFDKRGVKVDYGHDKQVVKKMDAIARSHKLAENPFVCRVAGDLDSEDLNYILVRDKEGLRLFAHGLDTITDALLLKSKGKRDTNVVFGEYHFLHNEQELQREIIQARKPNIIYAEMLGDRRIESLDDLDSLKKERFYDGGSFDEQIFKGKNLIFSGAYLLEWFYDFRIPIIGTGDIMYATKDSLEKVVEVKENVFVSTGRNHVNEFYNVFSEASAYRNSKNSFNP